MRIERHAGRPRRPLPRCFHCPAHYPLVADVDGDDQAEILAVANNNCGFGPQRGVYLYGDAGTKATLDDLGRLPIFTPSGTIVPLSTIAGIIETVDTNTIRRVDGRRTVTLGIIPPESVALESAVEEGLPTLSLDRAAMHASLTNLVANAVDACLFDEDTSKNFRVALKSTLEKDNVIQFEISDNGLGITNLDSLGCKHNCFK